MIEGIRIFGFSFAFVCCVALYFMFREKEIGCVSCGEEVPVIDGEALMYCGSCTFDRESDESWYR